MPTRLSITLCIVFSSSACIATQLPGNPPLFPSGSTVVFQGDSITDGGRNRANVHSLGEGYVLLIAAKTGQTWPSSSLQIYNRGIGGNAIPDMEKRWQADTLNLKPDVLSILIGINDVANQLRKNHSFNADEPYADYDKLIAATLQALPNTRIILCEPYVIDTGHVAQTYPDWTKATQAMDLAVESLGAKYLLPVVHLQQAFDAAEGTAPADHWSHDGIHPTPAGCELIANAWLQTYYDFYTPALYNPARNTAIDPIVNRERDSYDWLHRHDDVLDEQAKGNPDVVMIGDSITNYWGGLPKAETTINGPQAWKDTFGDLKVLNIGFGWDRTQNVLWRMHHGEFEGIAPKSVVVNIGTNNLVGDDTARTNTPEEIAVGIQAIVNLVHERSPHSHIFVMAVFPRGFAKGNELDHRISLLNAILAKSLTGAILLDIGPQLREPDGSISRRIFSDGTHPTEAGYEIWGRALKKAGAIP